MNELRVIRIPILAIPARKSNNPPSLNLSNSNAMHIFRNVLDFKHYEEDYCFYPSAARKPLLS